MKTNKTGNCVDKFIERRFDISIDKLLKLKENIQQRINTRSTTIDYFNTGCYEQDYSSIIKIRNEAIKLTEDCNKFLERISEQYSKLN